MALPQTSVIIHRYNTHSDAALFATCLNKGRQCAVLALEFSKGFDKVLHARFIPETILLWGTYVDLYYHGFRLF